MASARGACQGSGIRRSSSQWVRRRTCASDELGGSSTNVSEEADNASFVCGGGSRRDSGRWLYRLRNQEVRAGRSWSGQRQGPGTLDSVGRDPGADETERGENRRG